MADSKSYRRRLVDIEAFVTALTRLLEVYEPSAGDSLLTIYPSWTPKLGHEAQASRLASEVDRASGRAAAALGNEFFIDWKPRGTMQEKRVNPAAMWRTILDPDPAFPVDAIFAVCNQALGLLEATAIKAEEHERTLAGRIRRVGGLLPRHHSREHTGSGLVRPAIMTSIIGIPSALLVAYLVYRFGWS